MPYTAGDVLVRAIMTTTSGLPEDQVHNDFAFRKQTGVAPTASEILDLFAAVDSFYNATQSTGSKVSAYISTDVNRSVTHELAAYQIGTPPLGSPILTDTWLGPAAPIASSNLPSEVAGVLSFHGALSALPEEQGNTRPRARRRGRIYVGPLTALAIATGPPAMLAIGFQDVLRAAAVKLHDDAVADGWDWSVWSRANAELYTVVGGWTDNAPDTQRRRGQNSTARTAFTT